ncbi:hypothetical protein FKM82_003216 [Ascaphus truei]
MPNPGVCCLDLKIRPVGHRPASCSEPGHHRLSGTWFPNCYPLNWLTRTTPALLLVSISILVIKSALVYRILCSKNFFLEV